jgi:predicted RNA polymerase sigma factor
VPDPDELPARISAVLAVLFLVFNEGYLATGSDTAPVRQELTAEALRLARLIRGLMPHDGEVAGLLALMLLTEARHAVRVSATGELVTLGEQERAAWDAALLPAEPNARARASTWMFAALSTIEPPILELSNAKVVEGDKPWAAERLPLVKDRIRDRLKPLVVRLGDAEWLDGAFSAGDLMMASVLLRLRPSGILNEYPTLAAYVARAEARPAYQRAFAAQAAFNNAGKPASG